MHDERGEYLLTTSLRSRTWWRNLRSGAAVKLHLEGKERPAQAEAIEDAGGDFGSRPGRANQSFE